MLQVYFTCTVLNLAHSTLRNLIGARLRSLQVTSNGCLEVIQPVKREQIFFWKHTTGDFAIAANIFLARLYISIFTTRVGFTGRTCKSMLYETISSTFNVAVKKQ